MEAAKSNPDSLTLDEFLAFTHPESSAANQLALVDELYDKFDRDGDELLTEDEFAVLQTEGKNIYIWTTHLIAKACVNKVNNCKTIHK